MQELDFYLRLGRVLRMVDSGRESKTECSLCGNECENVTQVLWECSAYSSIY